MNGTKLKRDETLEQNAVNKIYSMFTDNWEETSKMSARQEMALVLSHLRDACLAYEGEEDTEEHLSLQSFNQYVTQLINDFQSDAPLKIAITGNDFQSCLNNLDLIRQNVPETDKDKIEGRFILFRSCLYNLSQTINDKISKTKILSFILAPITGFLLATLWYADLLTRDFSFSEIFSSWFLTGIMISVVCFFLFLVLLQKVIK